MEEAAAECGCKGRRTCLVCERRGRRRAGPEPARAAGHVYCARCEAAWPGWEPRAALAQHPRHEGAPLRLPGVLLLPEFLSAAEEARLVRAADEMPWVESQSGRRKQNFGPKTNFKKRKLAPGDFAGFPEFSRFLQERFERVPLLSNYRTIEQCSLEYEPARGAAIDPHVDDCWVWGERILTVNCLSDSVLTLTPYAGGASKYNLKDAQNYGSVVNKDGSINTDFKNVKENAFDASAPAELPNAVVRIPMPRRSLLVLYGEARYHWEHSVLREDIHSRRVCIAYREFTPPYLENGIHEDQGQVILQRAEQFWDHLEFYKNKKV